MSFFIQCLSRFQSVMSFRSHPKPQLMKQLPFSVFAEIVSFLDPSDLGGVICGNSRLKVAVIHACCINQLSLVAAVIQSIQIPRFSSFPNRVVSLALQMSDLMQLRKHLLQMKQDLVGEMKLLKKPILRSCTPPLLMDNIFELAELERRVEEVSKKDNQEEQDQVFRESSRGLIRIKEVDRAVEVAQSIVDGVLRREALGEASEAFFNNGQWEKGVQIGRLISDDVFLSLIDHCLDDGRPIEAVSFALRIFDEALKGESLQRIIAVFLEQGEWDQSIRVAHRISDSGIRNMVFWNISRSLAYNAQFNRAIEVAYLLSNNGWRNILLFHVSQACLRGRDLDCAIRAAEGMTHFHQKEQLLLDISHAFIENVRFDRAVYVASLISQNCLQRVILEKIKMHLSLALTQIATIFETASNKERMDYLESLQSNIF